MLVEALDAKLHRVKVTRCEKDYEGSLGVGRDLMDAAGLEESRKVLIANVDNGSRLETYLQTVEEPGEIILNGAAARLGEKGDLLIVMAFALFSPEELKEHQPRVVLVDGENHITEVRS